MFPGQPKKAVWTYYNTPPRLHLIYVSYPIYPPDQFNRAPSNTSTYFFNKCKIPNSALLDLGEPFFGLFFTDYILLQHLAVLQVCAIMQMLDGCREGRRPCLATTDGSSSRREILYIFIPHTTPTHNITLLSKGSFYVC